MKSPLKLMPLLGAAALCLSLVVPGRDNLAAAQDHEGPNPQLGQLAFEKCEHCHSEFGTGDSAPSLEGVVGRKAGSLAAFPLYSQALRDSGVTWDEAALDRFLANPKQFIPGTTMKTVVADPLDRADLIAYLKTLKSAQ